MSKLRISKGYSLIEIICSLAMLFILISYLISFQYKYVNLKKYNQNITNLLSFTEAVSNNFKYHYSYEDLINFLQYEKGVGEEKYFYINKNNLSLDKLNTYGLIEILSEEQEEYPYLRLTFSLTEENIITTDLLYVYKKMDREENLNFKLTKGDF